jgi:hypothetical protein
MGPTIFILKYSYLLAVTLIMHIAAETWRPMLVFWYFVKTDEVW